MTDFGLSDAYVGVMKGVILGINPEATLVDLSHQIPPQDIQSAGFQLATAYPYFPSGTVHLVVVDPGVGGQREAIAVDLGDAVLVGPNNGVFGAALGQQSAVQAVVLDNPKYWLTGRPSKTFHGRDIFAPVAAHLAAGVKLTAVGTPLPPDQLMRSSSAIGPSERKGEHVQLSYIQAIDHFGNLITNIPGDRVQHLQHWSVEYREQRIQGGQTYSRVPIGTALALVGSHGFIEVAVNQGSAQGHLQANVNDAVQLWTNQPSGRRQLS